MFRQACIAFVLLLALPVLASAKDRINGSFSVEAGDKAEDFSTINGSIRVADNASIESANTINGSIKIGDSATAQSLTTVNGSIQVGKTSRIAGNVNSVNGSLTLEAGAEVAGNLANVNGRIRLEGAQVGGGIKTVMGDIHVGRDSRVRGGIHVEEPRGYNHGWGNRRVPEVVIGPAATVDGELNFEHEVKLYVSDTARIGKVTGATPVKFSGDRPTEL